VAATVDLLRQHVDDHNAGVTSGDFGPMLARFAADAELVFEGVPVGPFRGVDAIAAAYRERPPDDVIRTFDGRVEGDDVVASYAWSREPDFRAGELRLTVREGRIARVLVTFV
jgi:hypothetical protein